MCTDQFLLQSFPLPPSPRELPFWQGYKILYPQAMRSWQPNCSDSLFCFVIFFDIFSVCLHRHCFASASKCQQKHPYTVYSLAKSPPPGELTRLPGGERGAARTGHSMHNCDQGAGLWKLSSFYSISILVEVRIHGYWLITALISSSLTWVSGFFRGEMINAVILQLSVEINFILV